MTEDLSQYFKDISDDCFLECDELLIILRRNLLLLEEIAGKEESPKPILEELLRSCHTLKGLTGMIGAESTMQLTHSLENFLKATYEGDVTLSAEKLDTLFSGVNMLEQQLTAIKQKSDVIPDASPILKTIEGLLPSNELDKVNKKSTAQVLAADQDEEGDTNQKVDHALESGLNVWKFTFSPTHELFEKGIDINEVRNRMQQIGSIIQATPSAGTDGTILFDFIVSTIEPEETFRNLVNDGIRYEAVLKKPGPDDAEERPKSTRILPERPVTKSNTIKVELSRMDDLMRMVGDLVITRARLTDTMQHIITKTSSEEARKLQETNSVMERQLRDFREGVMRMRLVPVGEVFERMKFVVRDLIRESGKSISMEISGQDTQIDKFVVDKMLDPLLHLVRNAVSHGIESAEERKAEGKPEQGKLTLRASSEGDGVIIEVGDDGCGINREEVIEKAVRTGIIQPDEVPDDETLLTILCSSGFSTREETDMISGRGVGMNVVKKTITELGGVIEMSTTAGKGTNFRIKLPITLSIVDALIVKVQQQIFAVPMPVVNEVISFKASDLVKIENNEMISYRETVLPIIHLGRFFHMKNNGQDLFDTLVVGQGHEKVGIAIEKIIGQREIVVRTLSDPFVSVEGINGATELGEGKVVLILDTPALVKSATRKKQSLHA